MRSRPHDIEGLRLLSVHLPRIGEWAEAARVRARLVGLLGADAAGADHADLAEALIVAAGGYVSPMAEAALETGMRRDPTDPRLRYYAGHALLQEGRPDLTWGLWTRLLEEGPEDAPWIAPIRARIDALAAALGRPAPGLPGPGTPAPGPDAADIAAAAGMSEAERGAMIASMVDGLAARLEADGGPAEEWSRLIRAYGVLGRQDEARAALNSARAAFAGDAAALALLTAAAGDAGLDE